MNSELVKLAVVGTGTGVAVPPPESDVEALVEARASAPGGPLSPEDVCLLRGGLGGLSGRAAGVTPRAAASLDPDEDEAPVLTDPNRTASLLAAFAAAGGGDLGVLPEYVALLQGQGLVCPHEHLPTLLSAHTKALREVVRPILGPRGRWLAARNPAWAWAVSIRADVSGLAADELARLWEEGTTDERVGAVATMRQIDPAVARGWLERDLGKDKADVRKRCVEALEVGLSSADLPLLESLASDRAVLVRFTAKDLMANLPDSALVARMTGRALGFVTLTPGAGGGLLAKGKPAVLSLKPPAKLPEDWKEDGVIEDVRDGLSKRDSWALQVLRRVPPSAFEETFAADPAALVAAAQAGEDAAVLLRGWAEGLNQFRRTVPGLQAWVWPLWEALTAVNAVRKKPDDYLTVRTAHLFDVMTPEELDRAVAWVVTAGPANAEDLIVGLVTHVFTERPLPVAVGRRLLTFLMGMWTGLGPKEHLLDHALTQFARILPPELFDEALGPSRLMSEEDFDALPKSKQTGYERYRYQSAVRTFEAFQATIRDRQAFRATTSGAEGASTP